MSKGRHKYPGRKPEKMPDGFNRLRTPQSFDHAEARAEIEVFFRWAKRYFSERKLRRMRNDAKLAFSAVLPILSGEQTITVRAKELDLSCKEMSALVRKVREEIIPAIKEYAKRKQGTE